MEDANKTWAEVDVFSQWEGKVTFNMIGGVAIAATGHVIAYQFWGHAEHQSQLAAVSEQISDFDCTRPVPDIGIRSLRSVQPIGKGRRLGGGVDVPTPNPNSYVLGNIPTGFQANYIGRGGGTLTKWELSELAAGWSGDTLVGRIGVTIQQRNRQVLAEGKQR